jgi:hypothetical protein
MRNETEEYAAARISRADRWVPACGGHETPITYQTGRRLLYCYNFARMGHAYLDCDTDMILTNAEAFEATGGNIR